MGNALNGRLAIITGAGIAKWSGMPDTKEAQNLLTVLSEVDGGVGH